MKRRKWSIYLSIWGYKESTLFRDTLPCSSRQTKHHHQLRTIRSMLRFRGPLKSISLIIQSISRLIIPNVFSITCGRCEFSVCEGGREFSLLMGCSELLIHLFAHAEFLRPLIWRFCVCLGGNNTSRDVTEEEASTSPSPSLTEDERKTHLN